MMEASWILEAIGTERLERSSTEAARRLVKQALNLPQDIVDDSDLRFTAEAVELAVIDLLDDEEHLDDLRVLSERAFQLLRVLPVPPSPMDAGGWLLRVACLGVLGDRGADASRLLKETPLPNLPVNSDSWGERVRASILDVWLRLIRKDGWNDLEYVQERVVALREAQQTYEADYLERQATNPQSAAWELVALYHLSKAAEILAIFSTQGVVDGYYDIRQQLEAHFDRVLSACDKGELVELDNLTRFLSKTAKQLVNNSIWTVTRAVNSRVTRFVEQVVRNQHKPIFEMLPPQRRALRDAGFLGSGYRAVVVNLPTSSGKTFIAQFRILQALNQFDREQGWVAYLAPTRALVNQVCIRLRHDFNPLGINVELVSPALEIDSPEASILKDSNENTQFRILVSTPEKFDLMLRSGWEEKIGRPLTLVVVDEAHNLSNKTRGIRLELLLSTINRECRFAQFLLLTPFINNATEIARWLSPDSHNQIELGLDWIPNDRAIVVSSPVKGTRRGSFTLELETLHTTRKTLAIPEKITLSEDRILNLKWSDVSRSPNKLAAATANALKSRGSLIVIAGKVAYTWGIADTLKLESNHFSEVPEDIRVVQQFLTEEFGEEFPLAELLEHGIGVHHSGLSDEVRILMEWLFKKNLIQVLVATTTIAQGVNFPISSVVMASHQYPYGLDMPPEDFWNLAGRAGRVDQGSVGIVALVATNQDKARQLAAFVNHNVESLNSTLVDMVQEAINKWGDLRLHSLYNQPEWSSFLQYLAHTYRQIGSYQRFANEVEQVLRGTLGFQNLRRQHPSSATLLIDSVREYVGRISGEPLSLVDNTGFSWESVKQTFYHLRKERITKEAWDNDLFVSGNSSLRKLMKILQTIPELSKSIEDVTEGLGTNSREALAEIISDWVNGATIKDIAQEYFSTDVNGKDVSFTTAMTHCCQNLFKNLIPATSWGLAALQTLTFREELEKLPEFEQKNLRNLPARVFYGVNSNDAITLRLLGIPRKAAHPLAGELRQQGIMTQDSPLSTLRSHLAQVDATVWHRAMGSVGQDYYRIWKIIEGNE
jgi:replicative superfamily II helicase